MNQSVETNAAKTMIVEQYRQHATDTGSSDVQVALLTARIESVNAHLSAYPKDYAGRHGLLAMVNRRRKLLKYIERHDRERYLALVARLGLRR